MMILTLTRGLLMTGVLLSFLMAPAFAVELKVSIIPKSQKEHTVTVNDIAKETINGEAMFEVPEGYVQVSVGKKKIKKFIARPSILQIYYNES
jgi:hypothetical protein